MTASVKAVGGLDGMTRPTHVNCRKHRQTHRAKDADRLSPKRHAVRYSPPVCEPTDKRIAGA